MFTKVSLSLITSTGKQQIRSIGVAQKKRLIAGKAPRRGDPVLFDGPEFSFMDGRGSAPLTLGQRRRYLQNKYFAKQIIDYMKQFELAKQLKPDENQQATTVSTERESQRHLTNKSTSDSNGD